MVLIVDMVKWSKSHLSAKQHVQRRVGVAPLPGVLLFHQSQATVLARGDQ